MRRAMTNADNSITVKCLRCKNTFVQRYSSDCLDLETDDCGTDIQDDYIIAVCPACGFKMCVNV